ncbi:uncharacterized protein LOC100141825 [Tribolium castaneum]|uniref:CHK kinase-like domain-containing protein n=1 Tax=Tribolium castaneum TaxID=7070 RepID=D6WTM5_TRICA|nr:PREDICTED: uncharacterized protein LOC100141825 [Tribolium castaneum]EFA07198.1 hypothetical protein TcasGA2_TC010205 [Tribolium castaneum]|eukprot:XP_001807299.1 PREDICTED: uncharacterized protein LOC100141825 [Tribolium castaneum]
MSIYKSCRKLCPDFIVNDFVTNTIKTIPIRAGYKTIRVTLKNADLNDKNVIFCATTSLSIVCRKGCLVDIVDIVIKSTPTNKTLRQIIPLHEFFARETFFYNTILVDLVEFYNGSVKIEVPTLIAATLDDEDEAIILQNAGWVPKYEKWVGELTQGHIFKVLQEFARLHALSFAFSKQQPEKDQQHRKQLNTGYFSVFENKQTVNIVRNNLNQVLKFFNDDNVIIKLRKFGDEIETFFDNVLIEIPNKSVLVHGDPTSNFLFYYEKNESGNIPSRAKLIDWHLVKFGSPVLDLSLFFFTNCDDINNVDTFLKSYHVNLNIFLKELGCDIEEVFSQKNLEDHWTKYAKIGLALAILTLKILTLEVNKRPNANNEKLSIEEFIDAFQGPPKEDYVRKIKDIVKYCVNNGLI